jgi:two-component system, OmpR family, response regulator
MHTQVHAPRADSALAHVLAVDDDPILRQAIADYLGQHEFRVTAVADGRAMQAVLADEVVDLVVLDLKLQTEDGMALARRLREESAIPIIMLTGRREEADRVMGLELGADDYLTKPFSITEFEARVRALLRRGIAPGALWSVAGMTVDAAAKRIRVQERPVDLTPREWSLLEYFLTHPGRVLSKDQIAESIFSVDEQLSPNAIEVQVSRLRMKIEPVGRRIRTVRGFGYLWESGDE